MASLVVLVLTHELNHVSVPSAQTFNHDGQQVTHNRGDSDYHDGITGYYEIDDEVQLAEKLQNKIERTIMKPDSYDYALALFVLFGKQWRPSFEDGLHGIT
ncbi:hypothetical protein BU23DRAFT_572195 [Bimuria novae-zelandiae CBS 107.79]|uniref:Uncharacterized protein n=1 Tax=Bimuria novae-zelandiae CBS 107.79 TaxID=1447943 RepID=A0A6A5UUF8_9PLEO|nr:hypothetical protein BU23DRAFT_572195 [Bimuria novae-zelandiae CBS 107.79]